MRKVLGKRGKNKGNLYRIQRRAACEKTEIITKRLEIYGRCLPCIERMCLCVYQLVILIIATYTLFSIELHEIGQYRNKNNTIIRCPN
jgi:hypothetical protein